MTDFVTAVLILLPNKDKRSGSARTGTAGSRENTIEVQFNPTSLRLQRQGSQLRSGMLQKNQQVQYPSTQAATLSFDLEFDTAEEVIDGGRSGQGPAQAVDVRTRTERIHQLVEPAPDDQAGAPHRVRFEWGTFSFQGVVTQLTQEFDYFAPDGTPLRSKMSLTIEEQDPKHEANATGAGARTDAGATRPGGAPARSPVPGRDLRLSPGAAPGRSGTGDPLQTVAAQQGESVQQVAARLGGDPSAWRSLMTGLTSPAALAAGTPVLVGSELDTPAVIGRAAGFAAGVTLSPVQGLAAALGLPAQGLPAAGGGLVAGLVAPPVSGAPSPAEAAGFALAAAGGLAAAARAVVSGESAGAVQAERSAFAVPRPPAAAPPAAAEVDSRELSYGRSVPLRTRVHTATGNEARIGGRRSLAARAQPSEITVSSVRSVRPWERLPPAATGRAAADLAQRGRDVRASTMRWKPGGECR